MALFKVVKQSSSVAYEIDLPLIWSKERTIQISHIRPYEFDENVFAEVPSTDAEFFSWIDEVSAIVGVDQSGRISEIVSSAARLGHTYSIAMREVCSRVPGHIQKTLFKNFTAFFGQRSEGFINDWDAFSNS